MSTPSRILRIFISSPGDVVEERNQARRVIEGLQKRYPNVTLQPVLWEELALPATASFQETIDLILNQRPIDIAIFILWSRLGSPLSSRVSRPDGTPYRSGTEREFDLMLSAFEQSGQQRPIMLAYTRDDAKGFQQKITQTPISELEELLSQRKLAESFIREQFHDADGRNLRAYQTYREPVDFVGRLRTHLQQTLDDLLVADAAPRWHEEPYRGLEVFDVRHADIFCGRDEETCDLLQRLRDQRRAGCAFAVIVGASGSGKSSIARAGVAATLMQHASDDGVKEWRTAFVLPSLMPQASGAASAPRLSSEFKNTGGLTPPRSPGIIDALARTLVSAVPELRTSPTALDDIAIGLTQDPGLTIRLSITPAFARAAETAKGEVRLLLVIDQMEELWTDRRITDEDRNQFFAVIEALSKSTGERGGVSPPVLTNSEENRGADATPLASESTLSPPRHGHITVLATLRSDFYPHAQQVPAFLRLKGERGHFDLLPPSAAALQRLIVEPARLAGLTFERHEQTNRSLDELIWQDATRDPAVLPLLQYALRELYELRDERTHTLTFAAYEQLGGVEGALGRRASAIFNALPPDARAALKTLLPHLVTIDVNGEQTAVRRRARLSDLRSTPQASGAASAPRSNNDNTQFNNNTAASHEQTGGLTPPRSPAQQVLVDALIAARFLTTDRQDDTPIVSLAHEALLRRWDELAQWITSNREHLRLRARVEHSQHRWASQQKHASLLLPTGLPLEEGQVLLREARPLLLAETTDYIERSLTHRQSESRRQRLIRTAALTMSLAATAIAITAALWINAERKTAIQHSTRADRMADEVRANLYLANIRVAAFEWEVGRIAEMNAALDAARPKPGEKDLRGWEWNYLWNQSHSDLITLKGPGGECRVAFSADGKRLAYASEDGAFRVWDVMTGLETLSHKSKYGGQRARLHSVSPSTAFSSDGKWLALGHGEFVSVLNTTSGEESLPLQGLTADFISNIALSPDGKQMASAIFYESKNLIRNGVDAPGETAKTSAELKIKLWDTTSGGETLALNVNAQVTSMAFSPDGKCLAAGGNFTDGTVKVWDAVSGQETLTLKGHTESPYSVAYSPDGMRLASASHDGTARLWDTTSGSEILRLKSHSGAVFSVAFNLDGQRLALADGDHVTVWDSTSGQEMFRLKGHTHRVSSVAFSPDGKRLASASYDGTVKVWDAVNTPDAPSSFGGIAEPFTIAFSPDGQRLAYTGRNKDGVADGEVADTVTGWNLFRLQGHTDGVTGVAFSPDGKRLASGDSKGKVKVWDAISAREILTLEGLTGQDEGSVFSVQSVVFSPDGKLLASAGGERAPTIRVWDATSGREVLTLKGHNALSYMVFSPDSKRLATWGSHHSKVNNNDNTVTLWDFSTGQETLTFKGHSDLVKAVAFFADGNRLASASRDGTVKVWNASDGQEVFTSRIHPDAKKAEGFGFSAMVFSDNAKRLATISEDGTAKLWDTMSAQEMITLQRGIYGVTGLLFGPDGRRLALSNIGRTIQMSNIPPIVMWDGRPESESRDCAVEREARSALALHLTRLTNLMSPTKEDETPDHWWQLRAQLMGTELLADTLRNDLTLTPLAREKILTWIAATRPLNSDVLPPMNPDASNSVPFKLIPPLPE